MRVLSPDLSCQAATFLGLKISFIVVFVRVYVVREDELGGCVGLDYEVARQLGT